MTALDIAWELGLAAVVQRLVTLFPVSEVPVALFPVRGGTAAVIGLRRSPTLGLLSPYGPPSWKNSGQDKTR